MKLRLFSSGAAQSQQLHHGLGWRWWLEEYSVAQPRNRKWIINYKPVASGRSRLNPPRVILMGCNQLTKWDEPSSMVTTMWKPWKAFGKKGTWYLFDVNSRTSNLFGWFGERSPWLFCGASINLVGYWQRTNSLIMPGYFNDIEGTRVLSKTTARIIDNVEIRTLKNHMNKMIYFSAILSTSTAKDVGEIMAIYMHPLREKYL